jgi:hypothetical protein
VPMRPGWWLNLGSGVGGRAGGRGGWLEGEERVVKMHVCQVGNLRLDIRTAHMCLAVYVFLLQFTLQLLNFFHGLSPCHRTWLVLGHSKFCPSVLRYHVASPSCSNGSIGWYDDWGVLLASSGYVTLRVLV